mgnify:CR=1 FL=1
MEKKISVIGTYSPPRENTKSMNSISDPYLHISYSYPSTIERLFVQDPSKKTPILRRPNNQNN